MPLIGLATLLAACFLSMYPRRQCRLYRAAVPASFGLLAFIAQFFRHPGCSTPTEPGLVVSAADGRVVHIGQEDEDEFFRDRRLRISVFLSVFDAHLTRSPAPGTVVYQKYRPGAFLVALHPKSSALNERNSVVIEGADGTQILVRQIAGFLARRICTYVEPGVDVSPGEEIGFIKLGSRVDLFLPKDSEVLVTLGQRVSAGETKVARWEPRTP